MTEIRESQLAYAMFLADRCWKKAAEAEPAFVERYLRLSWDFLHTKTFFTGDEFRGHCADNGLSLPRSLHHNTWVSGVRAMESMGWLIKGPKVDPTQGHNHMNKVTSWVTNVRNFKPEPVQAELF